MSGSRGGGLCGDNGGYIPLSRRIFDHEFWQEDREYSRFEAWLDMIQMAAYEERERIIGGEPVHIGRGEVLASVRYLATRWCWAKSRVQRYLSTLVRLRQLAVQRPTKNGDIYLLVNYDTYNARRDANGTAAGQQRDSSGTNRKKGRREEGKEPPSGVQGVELPPELDNPEGRQAVEEWLEYKRGRHQAYTPRGVRGLVKRLAGWGSRRALAAVEYSIAQNSQGVFEERLSLPFGRSTSDIRRSAGAHAVQPQSPHILRYVPEAEEGGE